MLAGNGSVKGVDSIAGALRGKLDDVERAHASSLRCLRSELDGAAALQQEARAAVEDALVDGQDELAKLRAEIASLRRASPKGRAVGEAENENERLAAEVERLHSEVQTRTEESMEARAKLAVQARQHAADVGVATATHAHAMQVPRFHLVQYS